VTTEERLIDQYVTEGQVMLARLGDHLVTLDALRDRTRQSGLEAFGLHTGTASAPFAALLSSHKDRYDVHMATYLRYAHIVLTYMVLEDRLEAFGALIAATNRGAAFAPGKGSGSLIERFESYLERITLLAPKRDAVEALRLSRNCIVHSRGRVDKADLRSLVPQLVGVCIDDAGALSFTTEGCLLLQESVSQYLQAIDGAAGFRMWVPTEVRENFERHIRPHLPEQDGE